MATAEEIRLRDANVDGVPWRAWGPYLSERQWGTVREDESPDGDAWSSFPHDQARWRAYKWGEDGIAGISDEMQRLCFALALWNGADPILKERLFGLTNAEGNHGEDVKEYYYYLDNTPTHSYMKLLYKYPHAAFPYDDLVRTNQARTRNDLEYELVDTGVFDDHRYFDVVVEYAKAGPDDILVRVTAHNRGPAAATLHLLPTLWFRNTWWRGEGGRPALEDAGKGRVDAHHDELGVYTLRCEGAPELLFTENETNAGYLGGNGVEYAKDGIAEAVVHGRKDAVNPAGRGTKMAGHYEAEVAGGAAWTIQLRLTRTAPAEPFGRDFARILDTRIAEADAFYEAITPESVADEPAKVMRQALASMLWSKQHYHYDLDHWLTDRGVHPLRHDVPAGQRNASWYHMVNTDVVSMPDTWEYPWYASWDLAFHTVALATVDVAFARDQLRLLLNERYLHPNGQIPAYEWNFGDVNPPVHALATLFCFVEERDLTGETDTDFLEDAFLKLLLNFSWWVNRKDPTGANVFEGGFLGLDNIGVFDRSAPLPTGGHLEQADATAWMALYSQNMLEIALELTMNDPSYADMALKFIEHYFFIAAAQERLGGGDSMWDDEDGFFYDFLRLPDGSGQRLKVRSMVGLLPLCAATIVPAAFLERFPGGVDRIQRFLDRHPDLLADIAHPLEPGVNGRRLLSVLDEERLRRVLGHMLDESEFLSPYGLRSLSRHHHEHPYVFETGGQAFNVAYLPAESDTGMFGGNSNWRGPIWFPTNVLVIRGLLQYYLYYGDALTVEHPTGSGREHTLFEVAEDLAQRLVAIFLPGADGRRPVFGGSALFQEDEHWRDHLLFYEYFHGDLGAGLGASHQTGWTGLVAKLIQLFGHLDPAALLSSDHTHPMTRLFHRD